MKKLITLNLFKERRLEQEYKDIKAIEKDGLVWHNVSDLKYWNNAAAKDYAISSIPSNILLNEEGVIVAKNLRGEDLRKFVDKILK